MRTKIFLLALITFFCLAEKNFASNTKPLFRTHKNHKLENNLKETAFFKSKINIINISPFQIFQRDENGKADIFIKGEYKGKPKNIEARWNGNSDWTKMEKDTDGKRTFSGTLKSQNQGQGTLEVRFSNKIDITFSIENIGVGDIYIIAGQSNASGRGWTLNKYEHPTLKACLFGNDDIWKELEDKVDSNENQVDAVSADKTAKGSPWPLVATKIMDAENIPVAFVPTPKGGTQILLWLPDVLNHGDVTTLYGSMHRRINAVGGKVKAILFFQGESDAFRKNDKLTYQSRLNTVLNSIAFDFNGTKTMVGQIGQAKYNERLDPIRAGQIHVLHTNKNAIYGPIAYDINLADQKGDKLHYKSKRDVKEFARRWYKAIDKAFYGGKNGCGPIVDSENIIYNSSENKIIVPFNDDMNSAINPDSSVETNSFRLENDGEKVFISSLEIVGNTIELKPSDDLDTNSPITLSYGLSNSAVDAAIYDDDDLPAETFYHLVVKTK